MKKTGLASFAKAETYKCRYRMLWAVPLGFLVILLLWNGRTFTTLAPSERPMGYAIALYSLTLTNAIIIPIMVAVIASRLCDMEIKGNTLKLLFTLERPGTFYVIKYLSGLKYLVFFTAEETLAILLAGRIFDFTFPESSSIFWFHFLSVTAVGAAILGIQQLLSLLCDNQILPLIVGLGGTFLGFFSMFFPKNINMLILWGYFGIFSQGAVTSQGDSWVYYYTDFPIELFLGFLAATLLLFLAELYIFKKKREV